MVGCCDFPEISHAPKCGVALDIYEESKYVLEGYSPFTADKYVIDLSTNTQPPSEKVRKGKR